MMDYALIVYALKFVLVLNSHFNLPGLVPPDAFSGGPSARAKGDPTQRGATILCKASWSVPKPVVQVSCMHAIELGSLLVG